MTDEEPPRQIVEENFKGLDALIEDAELREWYRDLIVTCIEEHAKAEAQAFAEWVVYYGWYKAVSGNWLSYNPDNVDKRLSIDELYNQFKQRT